MPTDAAQDRSTPTLLDAIADALQHPGVRRRFLLRWIERAGWPGSYRRANARLAQYLDPTDPHRFPAEALEDLIEAAGHAHFLDGLLAVESRVQRDRRLDRKPAIRVGRARREEVA